MVNIDGVIAWLRDWFDDIYLTEHQDITGKEDKSNKSSNITTDTGSTTKYPTVKAVEDYAQSKGDYLTNSTAQSSFISKGSTEDIQLANGSTTPQSTFATSGHNHDGTYLKTPNVFYGTCSTSATTQNKVVSVSNWSWTTGNILFVKFSNNNTYNGTARISIDSTVKDIATIGTTKTSRYYWKAGELVCFVYDGTNMLMLEQGVADTNYYGLTRFSDIVNLIYPVGSIYMSVNSTSPATLFGGTWSQIAQGRTLIGQGTGTDSNNVSNSFTNGAMNGEYKHTLSIDEMPSHSHLQTNVCNFHQNRQTTAGNYNMADTSLPDKQTGSAGGGVAHNNLPPYLVVYMWKRTA